MQTVKNALIAAASVGLLAVMGTNPAAAVPFTWNPSLTTPTALSSAGAFTASNFTINDYAVIDTTNLAVVTEKAILSVQSFNTSTPGLVSSSGTVGGTGSPYALYFTVTATSHLTPSGPGLFGAFDTLSYILWGDVGGGCGFSVSAGGGPLASCGLDTQLQLATGSLSSFGLNQVNIINGIPAANVDVTIAAGANAGGFWVNPTLLSFFNFETAFTNTPEEITQSGAIFVIGANTGCGALQNQACPGGGTIDLVALPVPEPVTLSVFGAGLIGAAALRRRKAKKA